VAVRKKIESDWHWTCGCANIQLRARLPGGLRTIRSPITPHPTQTPSIDGPRRNHVIFAPRHTRTASSSWAKEDTMMLPTGAAAVHQTSASVEARSCQRVCCFCQQESGPSFRHRNA